jgi:DNA end-binding protein Ku
MGARAIWKGVLEIGAQKVPMKLYAAVEDRDVHFHMLQSRTQSRVKQHMVSPDSEKEVARPEIRKGYELESGRFVVIDDRELESLKPEPSREIKILRCVSPAALDPGWYERPYYLGPEDSSDAEKYFALVEAFREKEMAGIARWIMRGKSYVGAVTLEGDYLALIKLRYAQEVLSAGELAMTGPTPVDKKEIGMAQQLVSMLEGDFKPEMFRDEYRARLENFIQQKAKGKHPRLPVVKDRPPGASLTQQLAKSLSTMKREREKSVA